jgi:putative tryptophan/tyrosine transport system substrate-binding protein
MKRREFIAGLGGAAAWPLAAQAKQAKTPVVWWLEGAVAARPDTRDAREFGEGFGRGLAEIGFSAGPRRDVRIPRGGARPWGGAAGGYR